MYKMWIEILLFLFLGICALRDGINKEIPLGIVWIGISVALILHATGAMGEKTWLSIVVSVLPAAMFWMISFITREKVGYGDGWVLLMIGLFVGLIECFLILMIGLILESVILLILLAFHKVRKDGEVPFVPFLLLGLGVVICL